MRVETPSPDGESLGEMVARLQKNDQCGRLQGLLVAAGYEDEERQAYSELTFRLVDERWYLVDDGFPRLTASTFTDGVVPNGLGDFRYTVALNAATAPPLAPSAIKDVLAMLVG